MSTIDRTTGVFCSRVLPFLFFVVTVLGGCASSGMKSSGSGSGSGSASGDYLSFPVGEGVTQYFIRPFEFEATGATADEAGEIDFTFREGQRAGAMDTVTANFTIRSTAIRKTLERVTISTDSTSAEAISVVTLYTEAKGDEIVSRYSAKLRRADFYRLFHTPTWTLDISTATSTMTYRVSTSSQRTITHLYRDLIRIAEAP